MMFPQQRRRRRQQRGSVRARAQGTVAADGTGTLLLLLAILLAAAAATKPAAASLMWVPLGGASECSAACASAGSGLAGAVTSAAGKSVCGVLHAPWAELVAGTKLTGTPGCFYASPTAGASKALSGYSCLCAKGATTAAQVAQQACWRPATAPSCSSCGAGFVAFPMAHATCRLTNATSVTPVAKRWTAGYVNSGSCKTVAGTRLYSTATSGQVGLLCAKATAAAPALVCYGAPTVKPPNSAETNGAGSCSGTATCALRCSVGYTGTVTSPACTNGKWTAATGTCSLSTGLCAPNSCPAVDCHSATCANATGLCAYTRAADGRACRGGVGTCKGMLCLGASGGNTTALDPFPAGAVSARVASFSVVLPNVPTRAALSNDMPDNAALTVQAALVAALAASSPNFVTKADVLGAAAAAAAGGGIAVPTRLPLACTDCGGARGAALDGYFANVDEVLAALLGGAGLESRAPLNGLFFTVGGVSSASAQLTSTARFAAAAPAARTSDAASAAESALAAADAVLPGERRRRRRQLRAATTVVGSCPLSYSLPAGFGGLAAPVLYAACCTPPAGKACASVGGEPNGCNSRASANVSAAITALLKRRAPGTNVLAIPTSANMLSRFDDCCDANDFCFMTPGNGRADCDAAQHACALDACAAGCAGVTNNAACLSICRDAAARLRAALLALDTSRDDLWASAQYDTLKYAATRCTVLPLVSGDTAPASLEECACRARGANYAWNAAKSLCACAAGFGGTQCRACTGNTASGGGGFAVCDNCGAFGEQWIANSDHTACTCDSGVAAECGENCCAAGSVCIDPVNNYCCPTAEACGETCCGDGNVCMNKTSEHCCDKPSACGSACCDKGIDERCYNASRSLCCLPGRGCGSTCCSDSQTCWSDGPASAPNFCCTAANKCGASCCGDAQVCDRSGAAPTCVCAPGTRTAANGACVCDGTVGCGAGDGDGGECCPRISSVCTPLSYGEQADVCCHLDDTCTDPVTNTTSCCSNPEPDGSEQQLCLNGGRAQDPNTPAQCCALSATCGLACCDTANGQECVSPLLGACCDATAFFCKGLGLHGDEWLCCDGGETSCARDAAGRPKCCAPGNDVCDGGVCCGQGQYCAEDTAAVFTSHCCAVDEAICGVGCCSDVDFCAWTNATSFKCCAYGDNTCCDGLDESCLLG